MKLNQIPKEELEQLSYTKIAELWLKENKTTLSTADLFKEVCKLLGLSQKEYEELIADFFQSLVTAKEFILLETGNWDLKSNHSVKININEIYEEEDIEIEPEERENDIEEPVEEADDFDTPLDDDFDDNEDELCDLSIVDEDELEE